MNLITISIGNTRTAVGRFESDKLTASESFSNEDESSVVKAAANLADDDESDRQVLIASVCPDRVKRLKAAVEQALNCEVFRIESDLPVSIGRQLDPETIVGEDRLLNAAAAYEQLKQACVVVDAGTAVTIDFVDGAGTFHGGAIAPGASMMMQSLHEHTAQLPEVNFAPPDEAIGHNTAQAMRSGAFHGIRGMVRELTEKYAEVLGTYPAVIATGGDADALFKGYELVEHIVPYLTLHGMAATWRRHAENAAGN